MKPKIRSGEFINTLNVPTQQSGVTFVTDHRSGRFDKPANRLRDAIALSLRAASIVALTETSSMERGKAVRSFGKDCHIVRGKDGPRGDTALVIDRVTWDLVWCDVVDLADHVPDRPRSTVAAPIAVLRHKQTRHVIVRSAAHLPAGVEAGFRARIATARAHIGAVRRWRGLVNQAADTYSADAVLVTADWNLDLGKRWVAYAIRRLWPELRIAKRCPGSNDRGTHGSRVIDFPGGYGLSGTRIASWFSVLPGDPATSDHRPIRCHVTIKEKA